jgi:hypothetical protein
MAATKAKGPNRSEFIRQLLGRDPETNLKAVNASWKKAGHTGSISNPLFYQIKSKTKSTSAKGSANGATVGKATPPREAPKTTKEIQLGRQYVSERNVSLGSKGEVLDDLEGEIDGLIFKLMGVGGMSDVEEALRQARRLIVRNHS